MSSEQYEFIPETDVIRTAELPAALLVTLVSARSRPPIIPSVQREYVLERLPTELSEDEVVAIGDQVYGLIGATTKHRKVTGEPTRRADREATTATREVLSWLGEVSCLTRDTVTARNTIRPLMNLGGRKSRLHAKRVETMVENLDTLPHLLFTLHISDTQEL